MYADMGYYWTPHSTQPILLECDIDLVRKALTIILDPADKNSVASSEFIQIAQALHNYLQECNNAFLASERIRVFLLLSLIASLIISFIGLVTLPVIAISVGLICILSFILFSVNIFTLFNQMSAYQQEIDCNKLKTHCSEYTEKLYSGKFKTHSLNNPLGKISSPTIPTCLFPAKKISQSDAVDANTDDHRLNHAEHRLPPIDEDFHEDSIESNEGSHLISFTQ